MTDLTPQEKQIIFERDFFFTKAAVIQKVQILFAEVRQGLQKLVDEHPNILPEEVNKSHFKISKGENYKGLPYVILDYPAYYTKEDVFAFRAMFWWGNHLSFSFHLQGMPLLRLKEQLKEKLLNNPNSNFYTA
ncbi:MAG: hypothetical protein H0X62_17220 [Bacteroidetes bacterium]|nr:hypothetical protein [Bacteroidota bacterium]